MKKHTCRDCKNRVMGCHSTCPIYDEKGRQEAQAEKDSKAGSKQDYHIFKQMRRRNHV